MLPVDSKRVDMACWSIGLGVGPILLEMGMIRAEVGMRMSMLAHFHRRPDGEGDQDGSSYEHGRDQERRSETDGGAEPSGPCR